MVKSSWKKNTSWFCLDPAREISTKRTLQEFACRVRFLFQYKIKVQAWQISLPGLQERIWLFQDITE